MAAFYINTYMPLVWTQAGRAAQIEYGLPPFVDGSIRREPDLEHQYPAITCLCRPPFAPRLNRGDVVIYMTKKAKYDGESAHRRLTAVLKVVETVSSRQAAARWYRSHGQLLPSNCMVFGNRPKPYEHSNRVFAGNKCVGDKRTYSAWDAAYRKRATAYRTVAVCKRLFYKLSWRAPVVTDENLIAAFNKIPCTQNPGKLDPTQVMRLLQLLRIHVRLSFP